MNRKKRDAKTIKRGEELAQKIKKEREKADLSQEELAQKAQIKIDTLRSIESKRIKTPNVFIVADLVKVLRGDLNKWIK